MRILALTGHDDNAASSRLRSYYLFRSAERYDVEVYRTFSIKNIFRSQLLHFQKTIKVKYIICAVLFRFLGRTVVFDIDDQPSATRLGKYIIGRLVVWCSVMFMMQISSCVTVDTIGRRKYWERFGLKKIFVIPDVIDIDPILAFPNINNSPDQWLTKFVWVGCAENLLSIGDLIIKMKDQLTMKLFVITSSTAVIGIQKKWPWVNVVNWEKDIMLSKDFRLSAMILNHGSSRVDQLKSENKMVLAIASGIIPIVSNTSSYFRLAQNIDAECLVYDDIASVPSIVASLNREWVENFFDRARKYIVLHYSSENVFQQFKRLIIDV